MNKRKGFSARKLWLTVLICSTINLNLSAAEPAALLDGFPRSALILNTRINCVLFDVYVARDADQKRQGLMHIRSLDEYEGMIFLHPQPVRISMWMKNTLIPLDMFFVGPDGRVVDIHTNAVPMSEEIIESDTEALAVIELNGGAAERFNIEPGGAVIFPADRIR